MSVPSLTEFNPRAIPWQIDAVKDIRKKYDYSLGVHEILFSGSIGSAKSILGAHLAVTHCLFNPGATVLYGRLTLSSLKDTLYQMTKDHIESVIDYHSNDTRGHIKFKNGSQIICHSWSDKKYKKVRSYALSAAIIEELTETETKEFYDEIYMRVGRLPDIKENFILCMTNPSDPSYWAYDHFIKKPTPTRHVYYSVTTDNPFLPSTYIQNITEVLDEKQIQRMVYGKWIYISQDVVYYEYDRKKHYVLENTTPNPAYPIRISFDFNIGQGKPMSSCLFQKIKDEFIFIDEVVIDGTRTLDQMEEWALRGYFDLPNTEIIIHGDATGRHKDTRQKSHDYDIIQKFLENYQRKDFRHLNPKVDVPKQNPLVRTRHNIVNGKLCNANKKSFILIDKRCKTIDEGLAKVKTKKGSNYLELEERYQHVTTAVGYGICASVLNNKVGVKSYV